MDWANVVGIGIILLGIFTAGTVLGTRDKLSPIIIGLTIIVIGAYITFKGEKAFINIINIIKTIWSTTSEYLN